MHKYLISTLTGHVLLASLTLIGLVGCKSANQLALPDDHLSEIRKNILFIVVDDLGYADIGAYNPDTPYQTPNIDRLAAEGVQFLSGYAASPVCSPSRTALLTGVHPTRAGTTDFFRNKARPHRYREGKFVPADYSETLEHNEFTLAEVMESTGYATAFIGKWHLGQDPEDWPEHHGFQYNIGGHSAGLPVGGYFSPYENPRLEDGSDAEYLTERLTTEAISLIDQFADQDNPFFMFMSFYTVHTPLQAPEETIEKYRRLLPPESEGDFISEEQVWPVDEDRRVRVNQNLPTYAAMVEHMDTNVGRLLEALEIHEIADDTIVVLVSDNGGLSSAEGSPTSNLPLRGGKGWLYEGGIRVPYILKVPGSAENGSKIDIPVIANDLFPTLVDLAGSVDAGTDILSDPHDGVSLLPILENTETEYSQTLLQRPLVFHYPHYSNQGGFPGAAIRAGDWKLIERFEDGQINLYNLADDLSEKTDLVAKEPAIAESLRARLHDWYVDHDAQFLEPSAERPEYGMPWRPDSTQ